MDWTTFLSRQLVSWNFVLSMAKRLGVKVEEDTTPTDATRPKDDTTNKQVKN